MSEIVYNDAGISVCLKMIKLDDNLIERCGRLVAVVLAGWLVSGAAFADTLQLTPAWSAELAIEAGDELIASPTLDSLAVQYRSQLDEVRSGFSLKRYSTRLQLGDDVLKVGRDWSGFQDLLDLPEGLTSTTDDAPLTNQVRFQSRGLALALEQSADTEVSAAPQLVLSWQGRTDETQLGIAVLGRSADEATQSDFGWGINLKGARRFGKLFTALGVSMGEQIDALLLGDADQPLVGGPTLLVTPQLHYEVDDNSSAWFGLSRYSARDTDLTLDTIHVGYQWQVLPGTQVDIEFAGDLGNEETEGGQTSLTIGAQHRF